MRFCLFQSGSTAPSRTGPARLGLLAGEWVVDVHGACLASLAAHMSSRRAAEIAEALCPSDLQLFLENGRHGRTALDDSLARLGDGLLAPELATPAGDPVVHPLDAVRLVPLVPWELRYTAGVSGEWQSVDIPVPEGSTPAMLHTDSRPFMPEYLAVVGKAAEALDPAAALDHVAMVAECRPSDPLDAAIFATLDEHADDEELQEALAGAVSDASKHALLHVGDVVRTGRAPLGSLRRTAPATPDAASRGSD